MAQPNPHNDVQFNQLGTASIVGPMLMAGAGLMIALPFFALFGDFFVPSSFRNYTASYVDFYTPIDAVPDKPTTLPPYGVSRTSDTSPAIAFMDSLDQYQEQQEQARQASQLQALFEGHENQVYQSEMLAAAHAVTRDLEYQLQVQLLINHNKLLVAALIHEKRSSLTLDRMVRRAQSAQMWWWVGRSLSYISLVFLAYFVFVMSAWGAANKYRTGRFVWSKTPNVFKQAASTMFKKFSDFLRFLSVAIITRKEPDMETITVAVRKRLAKDPAFFKHLTDNEDFLIMIMQQRTLELFFDGTTKHFFEREVAEFKKKVLDAVVDQTQAMGTSIADMQLSIRDIKEDEAGFRVRFLGNVKSLEEEYCTATTNMLARCNHLESTQRETCTSIVQLAVEQLKEEYLAKFDDDHKKVHGPALDRIAALETQLRGNDTRIINGAIAKFETEYLADIKTSLSTFLAQKNGGVPLDDKHIAGLIDAAVSTFKSEYLDGLMSQINTLKEFVNGKRAENIAIIKRLVAMQYNDGPTAMRVRRTLDEHHASDSAEAVLAILNANAEAVCIAINKFDRTLSPGPSKHGQHSNPGQAPSPGPQNNFSLANNFGITTPNGGVQSFNERFPQGPPMPSPFFKK